MLFREKGIKSFSCWPVFPGTERCLADRTPSGFPPACCKTLWVLDKSPLLPRALEPPWSVPEGVLFRARCAAIPVVSSLASAVSSRPRQRKAAEFEVGGCWLLLSFIRLGSQVF